MKKCPQCGRDFNDDTMSFCLDDGSDLLFGPASGSGAGDEPQTAILHSTEAPNEAPTRRQINTTGETLAAHTSGKKRSSALRNIAFVLVIIGALVATGFLAFRYFKSPPPQVSRTTDNLKTQRLTGDGKTRGSVISPDGKFLVYRRLENEKESLWIRQIQTNSNVQVVQAGELEAIRGLAFAPDGSFVYFNAETPESGLNTIFKVPTLGGSPTKFLSNALDITFSSDGKQIGYVRYDNAAAEAWIFVANADGTNERKLATFRGKQFTSTRPAWSPDGKTIAVGIGDDDLLPGPQYFIGLISTTDGSISELGSRKWAGLRDLVWTPAGDAVLIVATEYVGTPGQVWEISYPSGEPRRVTPTLRSYNDISITADGKSISLIESESRSNVWISPNTDPNSAKQIMPPKGDTWGISWTPDGRIVYASDQSGDYEIWSMGVDGSNPKQLTNDRIFKAGPIVSPDGRYVVYYSAEGGGQIFRIDVGGGNPVQLTSGVGGDNPSISVDSKWVLYSAFIDGKPVIVRMPIDGGEPQRLFDGLATEPSYSHDGKYLACFVMDEKTQRWNRIAIVPADGGEAIKILEAPPSLNVSSGPRWTPDGKGIAYLASRGEKTDMWVQPIDGGKPKQLTNFDPPTIVRREYSRDGKQIAIVRGEATSNAVLITGFR
ncbi:MAG: PD40 domain-containing protein [Chloracidobacterium sp.]|nr:PD40 domain-containing protein [Chloracidobacterium sp.]